MRLTFLSTVQATICGLILFIIIGCSTNGSQKQGRPYVILVSMDGFRYEYTQRGITPWLDSIATAGHVEMMRASFPTLTFPNHYTLATGLTPEHHGIVHNQFYDAKLDKVYKVGDHEAVYNPNFYGGEPIWVTAEKQGVKTACMYWVGNQIAHHNIMPTYNWEWANKPHIDRKMRIDTLAHLLSLPASKRPHLLMLYYSDPDYVGHIHGPESTQTDSMLTHLDQLMGYLYKTVQNHPLHDSIQIIITSDHGMQTMDTAKIIRPKDYLRPQWIKYRLGNVPTLIYAQKGCTDSIVHALKDAPHVRVWKREDMPARFNYSHNARIGDVVVLPDLGYQFCNTYHYTCGAHGFDPFTKEMHVPVWTLGSYMATSHQGLMTQDTLVNVDIYPLICKLLQIKAAPNDGQPSRWKRLLQD